MNEQASIFYQNFISLKESEQENFKKIVNRLLQVNYITNQKEYDIKDYYFITQYLEMFKAYFSLMDLELIFDTTYRVICIHNKQYHLRLNLRLNESIILLILRLLYDEKMKEISLVNKVIIELGDIHEKFQITGLQERRISKTELKQILNLFSRYNLLEMLDTDYSDDLSRVILYPTLLYAVHITDINRVYDKLISYGKSGDNNETLESD